MMDALATTHALGINPGGEVQGQPLPAEIPVPDDFKNKLLSRDQVDELEVLMRPH
jgi:hypothetical protein